MKNENAIRYFESESKKSFGDENINLDLAITALRKQIPSKPDEGSEGGFDWYCSECGGYLSRRKNTSIHYCYGCGQKLDWN